MRASRSIRRLEGLPSSIERPQALCPTRRRLQHRTFASSSRQAEAGGSRAVTPEQRGERLPLIQRVRIVPDSPSYFSRWPVVDDSVLRMRALLQKYKHLPREKRFEVGSWRTLAEFNETLRDEDNITQQQYNSILGPLRKLSQIHPSLMPGEVQALIEEHKRAAAARHGKKKLRFLDEWGRALGVGRRKTSTAKAYLVPGEGEVLINGRPLTEYFGRLHDRESALWALLVTKRLNRYNVFGLVGGGGITGQAEALTIAVAKALCVMEPNLTQVLAQSWTLYRDPRQVERKKPGHLKARKMPTWVKR